MDRARAAALFEGPTRGFEVKLWDGTRLPPGTGGASPGALVVTRPEALAAFLPPRAERRLAEAFIDGDLDAEGDLTGLLEAAMRWEGPRAQAGLLPALAAIAAARLRPRDGLLARLPFLPRHARSRDREAVRHHYDVSDDFYRLFLDPAMVYSCGFFARPGATLEEAQQAKLELVCRKLALTPGERLLDVGCGWGALLEHAARRHGARSVGVTLSQHQLAEARRRLVGVDGAAVEPLDYRQLRARGPFDKAASIGMMEHVGRGHLDVYFRAVRDALRPGGLFLNHAIADVTPSSPAAIPWASPRGGGFILTYIFPDGDLVPIGLVIRAAERAGLEVRDVESLREHYVETLAAWRARLDARAAEAERLVGRRRLRAYRLYFAASEVAFRIGRISVFQLLLARPAADGRARGLPGNRAAWYFPPLQAGAEAAGPAPAPLRRVEGGGA